MKLEVKMLKGECFFGGTGEDGIISPFDEHTVHSRDFRESSPNQTMPLLISNMGRCIWSEEPFSMEISGGSIKLAGADDLTVEKYGDTLKSAYIGAQAEHFPPRGPESLPEEFFSRPQYNTWMQHTYYPTHEKVLSYAEEIISHGFAPGIFIIDEGWQKEYGTWEFDPLKFPNPKETVDALHGLGFRVMLWVTATVRPDGLEFVKRADRLMNPAGYKDVFMRNEAGDILISHWWNGYSAYFDLTKDSDRKILGGQLDKLISEIGVDGFKFDGSSLSALTDKNAVNGPAKKTHTPAEKNAAWNDFGHGYVYNEFKDTFKGGGYRSIQRTSDRFHSWDEGGLNTLVPNAIVQGLIGHPFICPDMIGGGIWYHRANGLPIDGELFVRMAQCSALFPMMQFSLAPWEVLSEEDLAYVKAAEELHLKFAPEMLSLVESSYKSGEPIIRSLEYDYPHRGYSHITDQFMLGENILVAPVLKKGVSTRRIMLPEGEWLAPDGERICGGGYIDYPVTKATLPYFRRLRS